MRVKRIRYLLIFTVLLAIEIFIAIYVRDRFIRPYVGDLLVVVLIYYFIRIFMPDGITWLPAYIFMFAVGVEFCQYLRLADLLGLSQYRAVRVILGSTFDWADILSYGIGCVWLGIVEYRKRISSGRAA